jgi:hypothetical protein
MNEWPNVLKWLSNLDLLRVAGLEAVTCSGISVVRIEAADGYSVRTLIAYEVQTAIDTFR